jgi:pimeloyl-ACP methyl ester carboxylesterase
MKTTRIAHALAPQLPATAARSAQKAAHGLGTFVSDTFEKVSHEVKQNLGAAEQAKALATVAKDFLFGWPGKGSAGKAGWATREGAPTTDGTPQFEKLYAQAKAGANTLPPDAKDCVYLSVEGLYGNAIPGYMDPNDAKLRSLGLDVRALKLDTGAGVATNAQTVRQAILEASASGKQVVLIGHSKGGVDSTAALALYPELRSHVRAVVTMQSPYGGTPIASDIVECPELHTLVDGLAGDLLGASPASLKDLTYEARMAFVRAHPYPSDLPTVSMGSSRLSPLSVLGAGEAYLSGRYHLPSDGLVPVADAAIPGSQVVTLKNMDHADSSLDMPFDAWDPGALTEALVTMALTQKPLAAAA